MLPPAFLEGHPRFEVLGELGAGGFGAVYRARDRVSGAELALKSLHRAEASAVYRFKQEFRALADLAHPNLVQLYELLSEGDHWFFTMELVDGLDFTSHVHGAAGFGAPTIASDDTLASSSESKADVLARTVTPSELGDSAPSRPCPVGDEAGQARLRRALAQLAEAVAHLHARGQLHRDLKPSNVLVTGEARVVLLDFGLVKTFEADALGARSLDEGMAGTPLYMSPEQAAAEPLTPASDWYAVGVMLFEALTGQPPFNGLLLDVLNAKRERDAPAPSSIVSGVPADLDVLCCQLLARDPAARPSGKDLIRRLRTSVGSLAVIAPSVAPDASPSSPSSPSSFFGREDSLAALEALYEASLSGPVTALIHARSGMGKTALVEQFLRGLVQRRAPLIVRGRCYQRESVPFKACDGLVDALARYLRQLPDIDAASLAPRHLGALLRLFPVLQRVPSFAREMHSPQVSGPELRRRAFLALRDLLGGLSERRALVVAVDDLQWTDLDSVELLGKLLEAPDAPSMLLVGTYRTDERDGNDALERLLGLFEADGARGTMHQLELAPLESSETRALVESLVADGTAIDVDGIVREANGHPLFTAELVRYALARAEHASPIVLDESIRWRVQQLPSDARTLLEVACVFGEPMPLGLARQAVRLDALEPRTLKRLENDFFARLRRGHASERLETFHDRVREAIVEGLEPTRRRELHLAVAEALERTDAGADQLVEHFREGGALAKAVSYAHDAAAQAYDGLAFERAASLLAFIRTDGSPSDYERVALLVAEADALSNANRPLDAARRYLEAAEDAQDDDTIALEREAVTNLIEVGHVDDALSIVYRLSDATSLGVSQSRTRSVFVLLLRRARMRLKRWPRGDFADESEVEPSTHQQVETALALASALVFVDPITTASLLSKLGLLCLQARTRLHVAWAACFEAYVSGYGPRAQRLIERGWELAEACDDPALSRVLDLIWAVHVYNQAHFTDALTWSRAALAPVVETEPDFELATHAPRAGERSRFGFMRKVPRAIELWSLFYLGRCKEFLHLVPLVMREAQREQSLLKQFLAGSLSHTLVGILTDRPEAGIADSERVNAAWDRALGGRISAHLEHWWLLTRGEVALYRGEGTEARSVVEERWARVTGTLVFRFAPMVRYECWALRGRSAVAVLHQQLREGGALATRLVRDARGSARALGKLELRIAHGSAETIAAGLASLQGDRETAMSCLEAAIAIFDASETRLHLQAARHALGLLRGDVNAVAKVEEWMRSEGVVAPEKVAMWLAPGRWGKEALPSPASGVPATKSDP